MLVLNGLLSRASNDKWQQIMQRLDKEFHDLYQRENVLPITRRFGTTSMLAVRQWQHGVFKGKEQRCVSTLWRGQVNCSPFIVALLAEIHYDPLPLHQQYFHL
ncbi:hypothetical protein [Vreelandella nanhaiensis]|uniref:hypothetical protein n=1 Tax=Vreelandella nanhaiensis TaxID=1258546 RepID=UPI001FECE4C5|nr:hypothetical protein [Halomonas nanhaiensis]